MQPLSAVLCGVSGATRHTPLSRERARLTPCPLQHPPRRAPLPHLPLRHAARRTCATFRRRHAGVSDHERRTGQMQRLRQKPPTPLRRRGPPGHPSRPVRPSGGDTPACGSTNVAQVEIGLACAATQRPGPPRQALVAPRSARVPLQRRGPLRTLPADLCDLPGATRRRVEARTSHRSVAGSLGCGSTGRHGRISAPAGHS
jgi:hypothetical protein